MKDILSPGQFWYGPPVRALKRGNRPPVALSDTLSLLQDSAPVSIPVLINDFDPEGALLTIISATAVQGDVVIAANNTLTYTAPPGYTGPDTITYVVVDDLGQSRGSSVVITVSAPYLSIDPSTNNTLTVDAELGLIDVTITEPAHYAGTYTFDTTDLGTGPVNLVAPTVAGIAALGETLTTTPGLWTYDPAAGPPVQSWQWQRNGVDIAGAVAPSYTLIAADVGQSLTVVETQTDGSGARDAVSAPLGSSFSPPADGLLLGWWDAGDTATITSFSGAVSAWSDKSGGGDLVQTFGVQRPQTGVRTLNGMNVLDFDGGRLMEGPRTFPASGNVAFHMALEIDSTSNLYEAILAVEGINDFQIDAGSSTQFDGRLNPAGIGTLTPFSGGPFVGGTILSAIFDFTGTGQAQIFIGNALRATMAYTAPIDNTAALHLMTNRSKNAWVDGAVAEVIVTGDISNRADFHGYLATKWGLS